MDLILFCKRDFKKYMVVVGFKRGTNAYRLWIIEGEKKYFSDEKLVVFSQRLLNYVNLSAMIFILSQSQKS